MTGLVRSTCPDAPLWIFPSLRDPVLHETSLSGGLANGPHVIVERIDLRLNSGSIEVIVRGLCIPILSRISGRFTSDALPFYGRLVGAHRVLRGCLCRRRRALRDDLSTAL